MSTVSPYLLAQAKEFLIPCVHCEGKGQLKSYNPMYSNLQDKSAFPQKIYNNLRIVRCDECCGTGSVVDSNKWYGFLKNNNVHHVEEVRKILDNLLMGKYDG